MRRNTPTSVAFGKWLHGLRISRGLTVRQVAAVAGWEKSPTKVSEAEKGKLGIKGYMLDGLADGYRISRKVMRKEWQRYEEASANDPPVYRGRGGVVRGGTVLEQQLAKLTWTEKQQVLGYVNCLLDQRGAKDGT